MPMYNLLEYNSSFSVVSGSLWNYYRDELDVQKSFGYKTTIIGRTPDHIKTSDTKVLVPLKYLNNF